VPEDATLSDIEDLIVANLDDLKLLKRLLSNVRWRLWHPIPSLVCDSQPLTQALIDVDAETPDGESLDPEYRKLLIARKIWPSLEGDITYGDWLESKHGTLPEDIYLLEKGRWLRDRYGDYAAALEMAEQALAIARSRPFDARKAKIVALYGLGCREEAETEVDAFIESTPDPKERDCGLFYIGKAVRAHDPPGAVDVLMRIPDSDAGMVYLVADQMVRLGVYEEAERLATLLMERDADRWSHSCGRILSSVERLRDAEIETIEGGE
jgi:tetratricopeptide (TPR) repeat protein